MTESGTTVLPNKPGKGGTELLPYQEQKQAIIEPIYGSLAYQFKGIRPLRAVFIICCDLRNPESQQALYDKFANQFEEVYISTG